MTLLELPKLLFSCWGCKPAHVQFPSCNCCCTKRLSGCLTAHPQPEGCSICPRDTPWAGLAVICHPDVVSPCQLVPCHRGQEEQGYLSSHSWGGKERQGGQDGYLEEKQTLVAMKSKTSLIFFLLGNLETSIL